MDAKTALVAKVVAAAKTVMSVRIAKIVSTALPERVCVDAKTAPTAKVVMTAKTAMGVKIATTVGTARTARTA